MYVTYDPESDILFIQLNQNYEFNTDTSTVPGLALIYDDAGKVCAIEIEDASQLVAKPKQIDFEVLTIEPEGLADEEAAEAAVLK